jgi:hypothetical protein
MPIGIFGRVTTPVLLAFLGLASVVAAWLAIVLFGAVAIASMNGEVSLTVVVLSGSTLACALWWATHDIVRLGFLTLKKS